MAGIFFLKGLTKVIDVNIRLNDIEICMSPIRDNISELETVNKSLVSLKEVATLKIENLKGTENLLAMGVATKNLLSFALGETVIFDRAIFVQDGISENFNREMVTNSNNGIQIVPNKEIENFLVSALPIWNSFTKYERDRFFVVIDYLNQSCIGFIEDRILRVAQAWESMADFLNVKSELSDPLLGLRNELKLLYKSWKKTNRYIDENGSLGKRITGAVDEEKALAKLMNLVSQEQLNAKAIKLDLMGLKRQRDNVAHTGRVNVPGEEVIDILESAVKGLQIIVLRRLNYRGKIKYARNGWATTESINNFITTV